MSGLHRTQLHCVLAATPVSFHPSHGVIPHQERLRSVLPAGFCRAADFISLIFASTFCHSVAVKLNVSYFVCFIVLLVVSYIVVLQPTDKVNMVLIVNICGCFSR